MRGFSVGLKVAGAAFLVFGQAAMASADQSKVDQAATSSLPNDTAKRICKMVTPTGSRFTQRVCKTAAEWQRDSDKAEEVIDREARGNRDLDPGPGR